MDQLQIIKGSNNHLTSSFLINDKHHQLLQSLIQNSQLFLLISSFLTVPEIIAFAEVCKSFEEVVKTNVHVQNRILHCQVEYLTKQEEKSIRFSIFAPNVYGASSFTLFDAYFNNQNKMGNIGKPSINRVFRRPSGSNTRQNKALAQKQKKQGNAPLLQLEMGKQKPLKDQPPMIDNLVAKNIEIEKQEQFLKHRLMEDPEYKLYSKWSEMSKQKQEKVSQVIQNIHGQSKGFVYNNNLFKNFKTQTPNPNPTFWQRIKSHVTLGL